MNSNEFLKITLFTLNILFYIFWIIDNLKFFVKFHKLPNSDVASPDSSSSSSSSEPPAIKYRYYCVLFRKVKILLFLESIQEIL